MLVSATGALSGSVGGGRVEMQVVELAQQVAEGAAACLHRVNLVQDVAMCCGGSMEFYVEPIGPWLAVLSGVKAAHDKRAAVCVESDLDSGRKRIVAISPGRPRVQFLRGEGTLRELLAPTERVVLFGCGHLGRAIGPLAKQVDFEVVLCDDNETGAVDNHLPWADHVVSSFALRDIERQLGPLGKGDFLLILTRDHGIDQEIVEATVPRIGEFEYLGLIGSRGKLGRFRKRILAKQIVDEPTWKRLRAPIGLDIGAETPTEIAVSILAELISIRQRKREA